MGMWVQLRLRKGGHQGHHSYSWHGRNDDIEVEKSKDINIEIDIVLNTKDKAPGPAVIETAEKEHKEVSKRTGLVQDSIGIC